MTIMKSKESRNGKSSIRVELGGFYMVNRYLIEEFGMQIACVLSLLISKRNYFSNNNRLDKNGGFFCTVEDMYNSIGLTKHFQKLAIKSITDLGFIKTKKVGIPAKRFFYIQDDAINAFLTKKHTSSGRSEDPLKSSNETNLQCLDQSVTIIHKNKNTDKYINQPKSEDFESFPIPEVSQEDDAFNLIKHLHAYVLRHNKIPNYSYWRNKQIPSAKKILQTTSLNFAKNKIDELFNHLPDEHQIGITMSMVLEYIVMDIENN